MTTERPDPREAAPEPPFPEQKQQPPGSEQEMEPKPDHGEESYEGFGRLTGRVALVTGGDSGIGKAVAIAFAREGADVAVSYLGGEEEQDARETEHWVRDAGRRCLLLPGDIGDRDHARSVVERTVSELGRLDVLVNNAAYQQTLPIESVSEEELERTFRTNIISMFFLVQAALPHLEPGSSIINTTSIQADQPSPPILPYATTKGAIRTFTQGLGQQLAERGIRVNAVAPGPVWTPIIPASFDAEKVATFGQSQSPFERPGQPAEIAPAFVFLASDESRYVTSAVLPVTGGKPMG